MVTMSSEIYMQIRCERNRIVVGEAENMRVCSFLMDSNITNPVVQFCSVM
jgi:hypothetical protein